MEFAERGKLHRLVGLDRQPGCYAIEHIRCLNFLLPENAIQHFGEHRNIGGATRLNHSINLAGVHRFFFFNQGPRNAATVADKATMPNE